MKRGRWEMEAWWIRGGKGEKKIAKLQRKLGEAKEELAQAVAKRDALAQ